MKHEMITLVCMLAAMMISSCTFYKARTDISPSVDIPDAYTQEMGTIQLPDPWWTAFEDKRLNSLIEEVLVSNLSLEQAWARLDQAEASAGKAASGRYPQIGLEGSTRRSRAYVSNAQTLTIDPEHTRQHSIALAASYEVDLWGRVSSLDKAAGLDLEAVRMDLDTMAMSMSAQVAQTWFSLIEQNSQLELARRQLDAGSTYLDLVELRFSRGLASALDVYQQRLQLSGISAQIPFIEARISLLAHQLNILLGKPPAAAIGNIPEFLPEIWPRPAVGIPADLIRKRPDVQAARMRVEAADQRVASAVSDRFPRISISGSRGYGAESFADLFDRMIWSITGSLAATIYDGRAKSLEVERSRAVVEERLSAYGEVVLMAVTEVEDALVQEERQTEYVERLEEQLGLANDTLSEARRAYINGLGDYLTVLSAMNALQQTQRAHLSARYQLISYRIQLCRSLGGTWDRQRGTGEKSGEMS